MQPVEINLSPNVPTTTLLPRISRAAPASNVIVITFVDNRLILDTNFDTSNQVNWILDVVKHELLTGYGK